MDEPSSNLDMESIRKLQKLIRMMKDEGRTVLISEHRLWYLEGIADRYVLLEDGRITPRQKGGSDLYFFAYGHDYRGCIRDLFRLTGPVPLVPRWCLATGGAGIKRIPKRNTPP